VLDRLMTLNHERYAEEAGLELNDKKKTEKKTEGKAAEEEMLSGEQISLVF
jgi:hypothetical protein